MNWLDFILSLFSRESKPRPKPAPVKPKPVVLGLTLVGGINDERVKTGRNPLVESAALDTAAAAWARAMAAAGVLTHGNFAARIAAVLPGHAAGEDIAEGQTSVAQVVAGWMASPGHRANILGDYTLIGHGEAADAQGVVYWVVDFAL